MIDPPVPAFVQRAASIACLLLAPACASSVQTQPPPAPASPWAPPRQPEAPPEPYAAQPAAPAASQPRQEFCSAGFQAQFGWPDPDKAARVCRCESRGNPHAQSPGGRYKGLFQFSDASWRTEGGGDVFDPYVNSHHAHRLFLRKGWKPWPHCGRR